MPLKPVVDDLEAIEEPLRAHYKQDEATKKHVLQVEKADGWALEDVGALQRAYSRTKEELREIREKFSGLEQEHDKVSKIDPEKESERLVAEKLRIRETKLREEWGQKEKQFTQELTDRDARIANLTIINDARAAFLEVGADPSMMDLLLERAIRTTRVRWEDGKAVIEILEDGIPRLADQGKPYTFAHLAAEYRGRYPALFKGTDASGSGARETKGWTGGSPAHRNDFKSDADKASWIGEHGFDAFKALAPPPPK